MTDIELSLDEIIKKRNITPAFGGPKKMEGRKPFVKRLSDGGKLPFVSKKPIGDARLKLMQKQRFRTETDPIIGDARFRLEAMRSRKIPNRRPPNGAGPLRRTIHARLGNPLLNRGRLPMEPMPFETDLYDLGPIRRQDLRPPLSSVSLVRTVENEMPVLSRRPFDWDRPVEDDQMDIEMIVDSSYGRNSAMRSGFRPGSDISITVNTPHQSLPPPGILKRPVPSSMPTRPPAVVPPRAIKSSGQTLSERFNRDRNAEAAVKVEALKAQLLAAKGESSAPKLEAGHRIVVSNLVPSVTHDDVKELFADVGNLVASKLVRPGVAEVVYSDLSDAMKAVDCYHNRQLDGQPMKCLLVKNQTKKPSRAAVELDMTTLRNALHKKPVS